MVIVQSILAKKIWQKNYFFKFDIRAMMLEHITNRHYNIPSLTEDLWPNNFGRKTLLEK